MTKYHVNRFKMIGAVLVVMNASKSLWLSLIVIVNIVAKITAESDKIKGQNPGQIPRAKGATKDKNDTLALVTDKGYKASINLKSIALATGDNKLAKDATFTKTQFGKGGEQLVLTRSQFVLKNLRLLESHAKAAGCGVTVSKNDELEQLNADLIPKEETQITIQDNSKKTTIDLNNEFKDITVQLQDLDKKMLANMAEVEPDFYLQYKIARKTDKVKIVNHRVKPVKVAKTTIPA